MIPTSARFQEALLYDHEIVTAVQIWRDEQVQWEGYATDGQVSLDADNKYFRQGKLTLNDLTHELIPSMSTDFLAPYGTTVTAARGIRYGDGTTEMVSLGTLVLTKSRVIDSGQGMQLVLTLDDLGQRISKSRTRAILYAPDLYDLLAGQDTWGHMILKVCSKYAPWVEFAADFTRLTSLKPRDITIDIASDPWEAMYGWMQSIGYSLYFNEAGQLDVRSIPPVTGDDSVWDITEATSTHPGNLLYADKEYTTENTYNQVIITGETPNGNTIVGIASDTNPASPTYIYGPYGIVPFFKKLSWVTSKTQAMAVASQALQRRLGMQETLHVQTLVNPALEPYDVSHIFREDSEINSYYQINKCTVPLVHDRAMDLTFAARRL